MASLAELPAELLLRITDQLQFDARRSLSATNTQLHKFLEPSLFKAIRATNKDEDVDILTTVIQKYGRHVETLIFELHLSPGDADDDSLYDVGNEPGDEKHETTTIRHGMTNLADEVLSGELLPNIPHIILAFSGENNFEGEGWGDDNDLGSIYIHDDPDSPTRTDEREQSLQWRATINQAYKALSNRQGVKDLELKKVVPVPCSTFYTEEWTNFLSSLEGLDFELWGTDNGAGWHSNTTPGYTDFLLRLNHFFFRHLDSVKRLKISGDEGNPIIPLPFPRDRKPTAVEVHMPQLEQLELKNAFITSAGMVRDHAKTLRSLTLTNCFAHSDTTHSQSGYPWAQFFSASRMCEPILDTLIITNDKAPLTEHEEWYGGSAPYVPEIRKRLAEDSALRVWPYVYLDDKYGMVFHDEDVNVEYFEAGEDQRQFDLLMKVIEGNKRRLERN